MLARHEIFSTDPAARRELMVQVWYPARRSAALRHAPYMQPALAAAFARVQHRPELLLASLTDVTPHAAPAARMAAAEPRYPVLVFLEGLTGFRQMNTYQVEALVSHGYLVVALDQPYTAARVAFPDGHALDMWPLRQIQPLIRASYLPAGRTRTLNGQALPDGGVVAYLAQEVRFTLGQLAVLDRADPAGILTGRLDLERPGIFGISLGGIVAAEACHREPRLRACLLMDAPMPTDVARAGLTQPTLWLTRDADSMRLEQRRSGGWSEEEVRVHQASMRAVFDRLPADGYFVEIRGAFHIDFTDLSLLSPLAPWLGISGPIGAARAHRIINAFILAFFDHELKGAPAPLIDGPAQPDPEVLLMRRATARGASSGLAGQAQGSR